MAHRSSAYSTLHAAGGTIAFGINQRQEEAAAARSVGVAPSLKTPNRNSHLKTNKEVSIINTSYNMD